LNKNDETKIGYRISLQLCEDLSIAILHHAFLHSRIQRLKKFPDFISDLFPIGTNTR